MEDKKKPKTSQKATVVLIILVIGIAGAIGASYIAKRNTTISNLVVDKTILTLDEQQIKHMGVNSNQIIKVTLDGVKAYDLEGEEVWSDTLSLESVVVKQRTPYFAVSSKDSRKVEVFDDTGKQGEITTQHPIIYFSVNVNGNIATIEQTADGHIVAAYNKKGKLIVRRVTHFKENGFPMSVEISPEGKLLLVSYVGMNTPTVTSSIQAIPLDVSNQQVRDMVKYGVKEENNLVYEMEFVNDNIWVAVGDKSMSWYSYEGDKLVNKEGIYATYTPYLHSLSSIGGYIAIVGSPTMNSNLMHNKETLYLFDSKGEEIVKQVFDMPITYFYADSKGTIVGEGRSYKGFNKMGNQYFAYKATQDAQQLVYLDKYDKAVLITKDKVLLLKEER